MLVEQEVVVELKVVQKLAPVHVSQVLSYLRLADLRVGLLFNFNVDVLAAGGWKRILRKDKGEEAAPSAPVLSEPSVSSS